jgi:hypothetical protein
MSGRASFAAAKQFRQNIRYGASCAGPRQRQASKNLPIRMVAGYGELAEIEEFIGCGGSQSPYQTNLLEIQWSLSSLELREVRLT